MSGSVHICDIDPEIEPLFQKFRFRKEKTNAAIVLKIDSEKLRIILDEEYDEVDIDELAAELPDHQPRYVLLSYVYNHDDGRVSYPLCFIFISPAGTKPELQMMYAGSKLEITNKLQVTKVFELRSTEELTEEWLIEKLKFFR